MSSEKEKMDLNDVNPARRSFIKDAAAASLLGAVGMTAMSQPAAAQGAAGADAADAVDPVVPKGLKPGGQPDNRFPVSFVRSVPAGTRVLMDYWTALSQRDLPALAKVFHYPFVTFEGVETVVIKSPEELISNPPPSLNVTGKGDHFIRPGAYDIMERMTTEIYGPTGVGLSLFAW